jgi:hypothetical protein
MLERCKEQKQNIKKALINLSDRCEDYMAMGPNAAEWEMIEAVCSLLAIFDLTTSTCSNAKDPTINAVIPLLLEIRYQIQPLATDSQVIQKLKTNFRSRFDGRFSDFLDPSSVQSIATALEPNTRYIATDDRTWKAIEDALNLRKTAHDSSSSSEAPSEPCAGAYVAKRSRQSDVMKVIYSLKNFPVDTSEPTQADNIADQIAEYRRDKVTDRTNSIKYWIQNAARFPDLSSYALCILSIPASEVACERAFSTAGAYFSDLRVRMGNRVLRDLMFVHANDQQLRLWREQRRSVDEEEEMDRY